MSSRGGRIALVLVTLVACALLVVGLVTWGSAGRRTDDARERLTSAAEHLQACRADRGTYDGCQTGEQFIRERVAYDGVDGYELTAEVFGVGTFRVVGRGAKQRTFTCDARGERCSDGRWTPVD